MDRCRAIVEQSVRPEVVREINSRKKVAIKIGSTDGQRPAAIHFLAKDILHFSECGRGLRTRRRGLPEEHMFVATVERFSFALVHRFHAAGFSIENARAVLKIISNDQIDVTVAIEIRLNRPVREPTFTVRDKFSRGVTRGSQAFARASY